ncbi:NAD(P)/FAD-dependent oxidoreductase [Pseudophaeobacter flagellatus]|uniref:NAD(P)/FAD-dependent oxidoreductase n=1 Tax=Pseudophaeobacter flagellatus TaxID=2899119 RepID=UPI001E63CB3F|nr:FAD-binding oxidoreductase [Pseudophaeobacter flagellatus]MCD9149684.1 FAD-binding oxidoreductase [Pseudophaeobacter flagellatus]
MTSESASSLWQDTCQENPSSSVLTGEVSADLVIIGGGYTGCSAALKAREMGASVCLIEAETFGHGGSGRNVGLANAGLWLPPEDINARLGPKTGAQLSQALAVAPDLVYGLIERHGIACEPVRNGTLHCAHAASGMADLQRRAEQLQAIGAPVQLLDKTETQARVGSQQVHGALFDPRAGTIQPLAYARGLARAAQDVGAQLYDHSPATALSRGKAHWQVTTPKGRIRAKHLLMATNGYALPIAGYQAPSIVHVNYFQGATTPLPLAIRNQILPGQEGCWDSALVMSSWRMDQQGRLVIGAMGALDHFGSKIHHSWLIRKLAALFPALAGTPLENLWFGRIAMTSEHLPKIQKLTDGYVCFGYSGRGIGPGTLFGQQIAKALISGDETALPLPACTDHRLPFAGLRGAYYETGATLTHLIKDRIG